MPWQSNRGDPTRHESFHFFRRSRDKSGLGHARMTWASKSISRSVSRTGLFLRKQLWIWPIIAVVVLSIVGFAVRSAIESTMKANLASQLETLVAVESAMLREWFETQVSNADGRNRSPATLRAAIPWR